MKSVQVSGTEHYAEEAPDLLKRYESISFADTHRSVMQLIPNEPCRVLTSAPAPGATRPALRVWATEWSR